MKFQVVARGCELAPNDEKYLLRRVARLEPQLERFDPDLVHLEIVIGKQARRVEYHSRMRLVIMGQVLPVRRNTASRIRTLLVSAFDDLEEELGRFVARLRGNERWQRKRGSRSAAAFKNASNQLREERALLDRALAGDRTAFEVLADNRLAGVRREIHDALAANGHQPTDDELDRALATTITRAFRDLKRKPEGWSIHGWLSWVARRELKARYGHQV